MIMVVEVAFRRAIIRRLYVATYTLDTICFLLNNCFVMTIVICCNNSRIECK